VPALGANWKAGENGTFGLSLYGNGGMNTDWPTGTFYAGTPTGVNLSQMFVAPTYAVRLGGSMRSASPPSARCSGSIAEGVASFAPFSSDPAMLSNNG
jgi:long-chain fatty acid transport protein